LISLFYDKTELSFSKLYYENRYSAELMIATNGTLLTTVRINWQFGF